jgi:acyl-CoA synthetase (AMP-forming)/AMP-acid ligase II
MEAAMTAMEWHLRAVPGHLRERYLAEGWWTHETLGQILDRGLRGHPSLTVKIHSVSRPYTGTYESAGELARRVAAGLRARGIGPGDVVAFQLPNWIEAAATFWAVTFLGAVVVPIVHFYGAKEVGYILSRTKVRALVTADRFGHQDFLANLARIRPTLPDLELVAVVRSDPTTDLPAGAVAFDDLLDAGPLDEPVPVDPDTPALVAYTSGTTSDPKGVIHTHRTIGFEVRQLGSMQPSLDDPPPLTGAPVGHGIGMLAALLVPVWRGQAIHLIDVWDPKRVLAAMLEDQLCSGMGSTYFLVSLLDHPDFSDAHLKLMRHIGLGGAPVPAAVAARAGELGIAIFRSYGSTEHPSITGGTADDPEEKRAYTDGRPLLGVEMRLTDDGEILSRGPDCFAGYTDPALTARAFDDDGWYHTGDVGVLDADGWLTITDRKSDIIIRGGENISAQEVEEQLLRMGGIAECAVVAAPDPRLGERACAFVRLLPGAQAPTLDQVRAHMEGAGLARQKWPEDIRVVDDFPRTPSGKIQKFVLRRRLREEAGVA